MKVTAPVQRYLRGAWYYQKKADFLDEKIRVLRSKAQKMTTTYQDIPVMGGFADHRQTVIAEMVDAEREYKKIVHQCKNKLQEIHFVINLLDDFQERLALEYHYLYFLNWQDVSYRLNYTERQIHNIHGRALMNLLAIDKKIVENGGRSFFEGSK